MITTILAAALGAGLLDMIARGISWVVKRRSMSRPEVVEQQKVHAAVAEADASLAVVARSRDELEDDNRRLREQNELERARFDEDRAAWRAERVEMLAERAEMRADLDRMEGRLREALDEVQALKERYRKQEQEESKP